MRFRKTPGAKLKPFFRTQGSKLKVFPKNSMYQRFFNHIYGKNSLFCKFCLQNLKVMLKTATFWCKKHFLWLKINIYHWNLAIFMSKLKYFPQNSTFFQTEGKNSRKIQNSRPKLNDFDTKTQGTGGFYHLRPLENRTKKAWYNPSSFQNIFVSILIWAC